jgi:iron complex transport system permease protein
MTAQTKRLSTNTTRIISARGLLFPVLLVCVVALVLSLVWSITLGAADITPQVVYDALLRYDDENFDHLIIQTVRLPRVLAGVVVGAALAVAGAIMQGLTRNPLADAGLLGINGGAAFAVVLGVFLLGTLPLWGYAVFAFIGAGITATLVYSIGSLGRGGATPLKLTLAGVIVTAFIGSFTTAILLFSEETLEQIRFWTVGSLAGREMDLLLQTAPFMLVGLLGSLLMSRQITTISLGEDIAKGLGQNTVFIRLLLAGLVMLLAGGAVALAGPIGFVGLVAPHVARAFVGVDYRWVVPYTAIIGALLVTVGDVVARVIVRPQELPVGIVMALVGAPFFIYLARWKVKR